MDSTPVETPRLRVVLISGLSGAGKTLALKALEDAGHFAIDNLPCSLLDPLVLLLEKHSEIHRVAVVMDARDASFPGQAERILESLRASGHHVTLLFLEADTKTLIRRFSETRRPHPLARRASVERGVAREAKLLAPIRRAATQILVTSDFNVHQLKAAIINTVEDKPGAMRVIITSFGFKYGLPLESAFLFDVRYLPNPFFVPELRDKTGLDRAVSRFVLANPEARSMVARIVHVVLPAIPLCRKEGRSSLQISIGCTGGQHRSVAMAREVARVLRAGGIDLALIHRDIRRTTSG
jgi:UPF0042 nucleotide-binding protein